MKAVEMPRFSGPDVVRVADRPVAEAFAQIALIVIVHSRHRMLSSR